MKAEKLTFLCARCNGEMSYTLASGPIRVECGRCMGQVDAAQKALAMLRDVLGKVE